MLPTLGSMVLMFIFEIALDQRNISLNKMSPLYALSSSSPTPLVSLTTQAAPRAILHNIYFMANLPLVIIL